MIGHNLSFSGTVRKSPPVLLKKNVVLRKSLSSHFFYCFLHQDRLYSLDFRVFEKSGDLYVDFSGIRKYDERKGKKFFLKIYENVQPFIGEYEGSTISEDVWEGIAINVRTERGY